VQKEVVMKGALRGGLIAVIIIVVVGGVGLAAARIAQDAQRRAEAQFTREHRAEANVSQTRAEEIAVNLRSGKVVESHLEGEEGGGLVWEVQVRSDGDLWEAGIDAQTGSVIGERREEGGEAEEEEE
jgi:uncharacterized membrane protein YkoI